MQHVLVPRRPVAGPCVVCARQPHPLVVEALPCLPWLLMSVPVHKCETFASGCVLRACAAGANSQQILLQQQIGQQPATLQQQQPQMQLDMQQLQQLQQLLAQQEMALNSGMCGSWSGRD